MIEIVAMVYKSREFAQLIADQLDEIEDHPVRIVGNDPVEELHGIIDEAYHDPKPDDHYLSRVYRCWNYCVQSSDFDHVCLVNSDMVFADGWIERLEARLDGRTLPCSRLVEPGLLRPGAHAVEIDLGRDPVFFPHEAWQRLARDLAETRTAPGGLFMPCVLNREAFVNVGGYPEGNVAGISGDAHLFARMAGAGFLHTTCFDSLVYHFQEGEMRHRERTEAERETLLEQHGLL